MLTMSICQIQDILHLYIIYRGDKGTPAKHIISGLYKCDGAQTAGLSSCIPIYEPHYSIKKTDD
jgi:hypothetical protein